MKRFSVEDMSGDPLSGLVSNGKHSLKVIKTKRGAATPRAGLIFERPGKGRCEERPLLAFI
jgi:hypothetical protein